MTSLLLALAFAVHLPDAPSAMEPDANRGSTVVSAEYIGSARQLDVPAPRAASPDISIDGYLDPAEWAAAARLTGFTQFEPIEGAAPSEETEVYVLVGDDAVYFGIRALDRSGGVRATLTQRDGYGRSDDYVRVVLDTFNDNRRAYVFMVNPLGVQADGLWIEGRGGWGGPVDWSPDFLWESAGKMDDAGYVAEMKIPFKSLRFPPSDVQDWGLQIQRMIRRTGYEQSWAPITRDIANDLSQSGRLTGLRDIDAGRVLEFNPTAVGSKSGAFDASTGQFLRTPTQSEFGLNMAYGLTSNLTLDGTINPDFSQVEADAGQIVVNERYALYLSEQRPFFLEGTDVFSMPERLVYTRSIVNPIGAAKISGKVGSFNVAYLGAVDDLDGGASSPAVNLLRVKRDLGGSSSIGLAYTDRTEAGVDFNRVVGADARLVLGRRYTLTLMGAGSADGSAGDATTWGSLVSARLNRSGRALSLSGSFKDIDDDFRARSGFIRETGITEAQGRVGYTFRGVRGALVESWGPSLEVEQTWDRNAFWSAGAAREDRLSATVMASFRGNVAGFLSYRRNGYNFADGDYGSFYSGADEASLQPLNPDRSLFEGLQTVSLRSFVSTWERVRGSIAGTWGETPLFSAGVPVDVGETWSGDVGLTLYPTGSMQAELGVRHVSIFRSRDGSRYSSATIPRLQARYQITRAMYVRAIGEYSSQERGDLLDPVTGDPVFRCSTSACSARVGSDAHDFRLEGLLGYEPSPGTVLFLGYTRQFTDSSAFDFSQIRTRADGLFVKLSYRFRM